MPVRGQEDLRTVGWGGMRGPWKAQWRAAGSGLAAVGAPVRGSGAPARIQASRSAICSGFKAPPLGGMAFTSAAVPFTTWMSKLESGFPGITDGVPEAPPFSQPALKSKRNPPLSDSDWAL